MRPGEERGDAQCPGLRVRCSASGKKVFFYRYRSKDGALREIRLGDVGPMTLAKARGAVLKKRVERDQGKTQLDKRKGRGEAMRERLAEPQARIRSRIWLRSTSKEALSLQKRDAESARLLRKDFLPLFGSRPAIQPTRRELQEDELIRPTLLKHPGKATQLLSRIRCAYAHAIQQGAASGSVQFTNVRNQGRVTGAEEARADGC